MSIRELWAKVPKVACQNCGECCGPVEMAPIEKQIITEFCSRNNISLGDFFSGTEARLFAGLMSQDGWQCPMRRDGKCQIYEVRPLVCRLQGATPRLVCPNFPNRKYPLGVTEAGCLVQQSWRASR